MTHANSTPSSATDSNSASEIPDVVLAMLAAPPLLPTETVKDLVDIFHSFMVAIPAQSKLDYYMYFEMSVLTFEVIRYRRMKILILKNAERSTVEDIIRKTQPGTEVGAPWQVIEHETAKAMRKYQTDPDYRNDACERFEAAGFDKDFIAGEAFSAALPKLSVIEKLIVSAQRRLNFYLTSRRHDPRVGTMRATAESAINKE